MGVLKNLSLQRPEDMLEGKDDALECEQIIRAMAAWLRLQTYSAHGAAVYRMDHGRKRFVPTTKDKSIAVKYTAELDYLYDDNFLGNANKELFKAIHTYDDKKKQFVCEHEGEKVCIDLMLYKSELKKATSNKYGGDVGADTRFFSEKKAFREEFERIREMFPLTIPIVEEASSHDELHSMQQAEAERVEAERKQAEAERVEAERKQEEAKRQQEEEDKRQQEEAKRQEEEDKRQQEEAKRQEEEAQRQQEEEDKRKQAEREKAKRQEEEAKRQQEEDKRKQAEREKAARVEAARVEAERKQAEEDKRKKLRKRNYEKHVDWQQGKFGSAYVPHESAAKVNNKALREALEASRAQYKEEQKKRKKDEKMTLGEWEERYNEEVAPKIKEDKQAKREAADKKRKAREEKWEREKEAAKVKAAKKDEEPQSEAVEWEASMLLRLDAMGLGLSYAPDMPCLDDARVKFQVRQAMQTDVFADNQLFQESCETMSEGMDFSFLDLFSRLEITSMAGLFTLFKDWRQQKLRFLGDTQASASKLLVDVNKLKRIVTDEVCKYMKLTSGQMIEAITLFLEKHLEEIFKAFSKLNLNVERKLACQALSPELLKCILKHGWSTYLMVFLDRNGIKTMKDLDIFFKDGEVDAETVQGFVDTYEVAGCVDLEGEAFIDKFTEMLQAVKA